MAILLTIDSDGKVNYYGSHYCYILELLTAGNKDLYRESFLFCQTKLLYLLASAYCVSGITQASVPLYRPAQDLF